MSFRACPEAKDTKSRPTRLRVELAGNLYCKFQTEPPPGGSDFGGRPQSPGNHDIIKGSDYTTNRTKSIYTRVTPQEKQHIQVRARTCGLSVSEYLRQRALGYSPRAIPPDQLHLLRTELQRLRKADRSVDADRAIQGVLDEIRDTFILPGRDS